MPEAGGTGAEAVATQTTSLAGHSADSAAKPTGIDRGDRPPLGQHPATGPTGGTFGPQPRTPPERGLFRGSEGARPPASLRRGLTECGHKE